MDVLRKLFSPAELSAMRLDGELFEPLGGLCRADEPDTPLLRARIVLTEAPARLIVERRSAAWVWGALPEAPRQHSVCFDVAERSTKIVTSPWTIRNTSFAPEDVWRTAGVAVTSPWRTLCDLIRLGDVRLPADGAVILALLALERLSVPEAIDRAIGDGSSASVRLARRLALLDQPSHGRAA